jgi:hypothetical protein
MTSVSSDVPFLNPHRIRRLQKLQKILYVHVMSLYVCDSFAELQSYRTFTENIVAYLRHARTVTSKHAPAIKHLLTKRCFLCAE